MRWGRVLGVVAIVMLFPALLGLQAAAPPHPAGRKPAAVTVYNGSDHVGLEQIVAERLRTAGYEVVADPEPSPMLAQSSVRALDDPAAADRVAAALRLKFVNRGEAEGYPPRTEPGADLPRVVVILGNDAS